MGFVAIPQLLYHLWFIVNLPRSNLISQICPSGHPSLGGDSAWQNTISLWMNINHFLQQHVYQDSKQNMDFQKPTALFSTLVSWSEENQKLKENGPKSCGKHGELNSFDDCRRADAFKIIYLISANCRVFYSILSTFCSHILITKIVMIMKIFEHFGSRDRY